MAALITVNFPSAFFLLFHHPCAFRLQQHQHPDERSADSDEEDEEALEYIPHKKTCKICSLNSQ